MRFEVSCNKNVKYVLKLVLESVTQNEWAIITSAVIITSATVNMYRMYDNLEGGALKKNVHDISSLDIWKHHDTKRLVDWGRLPTSCC